MSKCLMNVLELKMQNKVNHLNLFENRKVFELTTLQ